MSAHIPLGLIWILNLLGIRVGPRLKKMMMMIMIMIMKMTKITKMMRQTSFAVRGHDKQRVHWRFPRCIWYILEYVTHSIPLNPT